LNVSKVKNHIVSWLDTYLATSGLEGFIIGISGGVDSAVTSTLCANTGKKTILVNMPIRQTSTEYKRACEHIDDLCLRFPNVQSMEIDLSDSFALLVRTLPAEVKQDTLAMANTRARLRMTTLYAIGQTNRCLVAGTGNKVEDFGVGFFTKYGDGGVDLSPIADLNKSEVKLLATELGVVNSIVVAKPTDGLWEDGRSDEDQLGASYPELEWAMEFHGDESTLNARENEVLAIYRRFNRINRHKMEPIPVCNIPEELKKLI
jgi:NAD+ synthase